jgi:hypothetical protein
MCEGLLEHPVYKYIFLRQIDVAEIEKEKGAAGKLEPKLNWKGWRRCCVPRTIRQLALSATLKKPCSSPIFLPLGMMAAEMATVPRELYSVQII